MGETRTQSERLGGIDLRVRGDRSVVMRKENGQVPANRFVFYLIAEYLKFWSAMFLWASDEPVNIKHLKSSSNWIISVLILGGRAGRLPRPDRDVDKTLWRARRDGGERDLKVTSVGSSFSVSAEFIKDSSPLDRPQTRTATVTATAAITLQLQLLFSFFFSSFWCNSVVSERGLGLR